MAVQVEDQPAPCGMLRQPAQEPHHRGIIEVMREQTADHHIEAAFGRQVEQVGGDPARWNPASHGVALRPGTAVQAPEVQRDAALFPPGRNGAQRIAAARADIEQRQAGQPLLGDQLIQKA